MGDTDHFEGFIYVLLNAALPGLVKIGKTTRNPEERAQELSSASGVPSRFQVAYQIGVSDCHKAEAAIHTRLEEHRYSEQREFFQLSLPEAERVVKEEVAVILEEEIARLSASLKAKVAEYRRGLFAVIQEKDVLLSALRPPPIPRLPMIYGPDGRPARDQP